MKDFAYEKETLAFMKSLTLLCVEDDKTTQFLYDAMFEDYFKEIVYAYDGNEAYQKYRDNKIDFVISDYEMPNCNGLDMIKKIRENNKNIPIILASAIENVDVIVDALQVGVNSFIKKPIQKENILKSVEDAVKLLIANNILEKQKTKDLYVSYQEELGLSKELNILRNDFYYQMMESDGIHLVDFLYHPLDVLSGDAYSARRIDEDNTFYLMVDGMGKGLSASLTAMIMTSFINHVLDKMLRTDDFDLSLLIHETMEYIKPILLEEEALAIDYVLVDNKDEMLYYAKFAMPVLLMENNDSQIVRLKSNNPPLSKWIDTFNMGSYDISDIKKFLIYSDGIVENETIFDDKPYADYIEEDFKNSFTREDLKESFLGKIKDQEDDITLIYIHNLKSTSVNVSQKVFSATLEDLEHANEWYENIFKSLTEDTNLIYKTGLVFTELYMNAYEHGSLGIDSTTKHGLVENDEYFETLLETEKNSSKKISVKIDKIQHNSSVYILTHIKDEGDGFDTQILSEIFRNSAAFNGRGVFVSRKNSLGIYYNAKGNSVLFLSKV